MQMWKTRCWIPVEHQLLLLHLSLNISSNTLTISSHWQIWINFATFRVILIELKSSLTAKKVFAGQHKESLELVKVGYGTLILISVRATSGQRNLCCTCSLQCSRPQLLVLNRLFDSSGKGRAGQERGQSKGLRQGAAFFLFCISSSWLLRQWCKSLLNACQEPKG